MRIHKLMLGALLAATFAAGAAGCKTVYEPVRVRQTVTETNVDPMAMELPEAGRPGTPLQRDVVVMQPRTVVDWDGIGRGTGRVLEGIGVGLLYAGWISLEVLAHCAHCFCK